VPDRLRRRESTNDDPSPDPSAAPPPPQDERTLRALLVTNAYRNAQPGVTATGYRSFPLRFRAAGERAWAEPAEEFLAASRLRRHDRAARESAQSYVHDDAIELLARVDLETRQAGAVPLPGADRLDAPLAAVIAARRSCRDFAPEPIGLRELATILAGCAGVTGEQAGSRSDGVDVPLSVRAIPSAGGLYPIETYVLAQRVVDLAPATYRYVARTHELTAHVAFASPADLSVAPADAERLAQAAVLLLFVARPWRSMRKYGPRGLRFALLEAGAMTQGVHLAAWALGLGSLDCGSLCDDDAHRVLALDGTYAALVHSVLVGARAQR
jgi:SagB-type dehydrogenase family enzyme